jgi:hypothetical protein
VLLAHLTDEPITTSDLYDRVGYVTLARIGLIPYQAFRDELAKLSSSGLAEMGRAGDGSATWRLPQGAEDG